MKNTLLLTFITILFFGSSSGQSPKRMFEVRVESKIEGCTRRHDVMVEARNSHEAKSKAQRIVQHKLTTRALTTKEIKR